MSQRTPFVIGAAVCAIAAAAFSLPRDTSPVGSERANAQGPAGCYGGADACRASLPEPTRTKPKSAPAPQQSEGFAGTWTGRGDGAEAVVQIRQASETGYTVHHEIDSKTGCTGTAQGAANAAGNKLVLRVPIDNENLCLLTYTRSGNRMTVSEEGCMYLHPATCAFDGAVTRKAAAASTTSAASKARPATWLVGAWVPQGASCASEDTVKFNNNGTYTSGYMVNGSWRLVGGQLQVIYTESGPDEAPGPEIQRTPSIAQVNANEMRLGGTRMRRCPARGGIEPWHPHERFTVD